jgi:hypothetical protein
MSQNKEVLIEDDIGTILDRYESKLCSGSISQFERNLVEIAYDLIYEEVKTLTDSKDSTTTNEQAFYSPDYGKITHRQILKICKTPFRGEPGRKDSGKIDNESSCQEFHLR